MFLCQVNDRTGLQLVEPRHATDLFAVIDANREHLRRWHGWVDSIRTVDAVEKCIERWRQQILAGQRVVPDKLTRSQKAQSTLQPSQSP